MKKGHEFGTWNIRSLYRSDSLTTVARGLARYTFDLVSVQDVRWDKGGTITAGIIFFSMEKEMKIINLEQTFFAHHRIVSAVKRAEFVTERVSYIVLRGCWCNSILNVHTQSEEKSDDSKDSFYEELEQIFDHFPKYHMKILFRRF